MVTKSLEFPADRLQNYIPPTRFPLNLNDKWLAIPPKAGALFSTKSQEYFEFLFNDEPEYNFSSKYPMITSAQGC